MPIEILMPALSPTMTEGNLAKWYKKEGEDIKAGDVIAEIETDKATMEVEAVDEGVLGKIFVDSGAKNVKVNQVIALLLIDGEDEKSIKDYKLPEIKEEPKEEKKSDKTEDKPVKTPEVKATQAPKKPAPTPQVTQQAVNIDTSKIRISPVAKKLAQKANLDISNIVGTGPHGRITKKDVEEFISMGGAFAGNRGNVIRNQSEYSVEPTSTMRQVIAQRLLESKVTVPHFYLTIECEIDKLLESRVEINKLAQKPGDDKPAYKISVNDFVIKAVAMALRDIPAANASWDNEQIIKYNNVDVAVAVAIDGGLITPIVKNADQKELKDISNEMKDLAKRAKANSLSVEEFQGGSFTISNLGMYGIDTFQAIINPPQSCILAVGRSVKKPIIKNDQMIIANMMNVSLSADHRVVDGAVGAQFLAAFKRYIENPILMFV